MSDPRIFDRLLLRRRRDRAAATLGAHDFLLREMAVRLAERLEEIRRTFPLALDLGAHAGQVAAALPEGKVGALVQMEASSQVLRASGLRVRADEEFLPFAPESFDLVLSCLSLHAVNDLPGTLTQAQRVLKPDGLFLAVMPAGDTLHELRAAFMQASLEVQGGAGLHVAPFVDARQAGGLLQRAGFALPMADVDSLSVQYAHPLALMHDLRGMGETSVLTERARKPLRRDVLARVVEHYPRDADGRITATVETVTLTGWKPHESQPRPLARGSGKMNLGEIF